MMKQCRHRIKTGRRSDPSVTGRFFTFTQNSLSGATKSLRKVKLFRRLFCPSNHLIAFVFNGGDKRAVVNRLIENDYGAAVFMADFRAFNSVYGLKRLFDAAGAMSAHHAFNFQSFFHNNILLY